MTKGARSQFASRAGLIAAVAISIAITVGLMFYLYRPVGHGVDINQRPIGQDFINVWAAPNLATHGHLADLFVPTLYAYRVSTLYGQMLQPYVWSYPPSTLMLYYPFSLLPYFVSMALWTALGLGLWLLTYRAYAGKLDFKATALLLLSPACAMNVIDGQNAFFGAALFIGGLLLLPRRPIVAGILFGILTFKPQIGIVLPFALLAMREWKAIAAATATFAVFAAASIFCFGVDAWVKYMTITSSWQIGASINLHGLASVMGVAPLNGMRVIGVVPQYAIAMQMAISTFAIVILCQTLRRTSDARQRIFLLCSAAPVVSPYLLNYDLCLLTVPIVFSLLNAAGSGWDRFNLYLLAWLMPTVGLALAFTPVGGFQAIIPLIVIAVFLTVVVDVQKRFEQGDGTPRPSALS